MLTMTNPFDALESFQEALLGAEIGLQPGELDPKLYVHMDTPNGERRLTYARLQGQTVTALAILISAEPIERTPCFGIGYAVPPAYRNHGRAKDVIRAAIAELRNGLSRNGILAFYVEAIVGADNKASQRVAEQTLSTTPEAGTDKVSGLPCLQYLLKVA